MLRNASMRTRERDITHSRMPSKLPAPVLPPSTHVVTPVARATSSVRGPKSEAPAKQCACRSMSPGNTSRPLTSSTVSPSGASPARTSVTRPSRTRTPSAPVSPAPGPMTCPPRSSTPIGSPPPAREHIRVRSGAVSLPEGVLLSQGSPLLAALQRLARDARCVFFAGLSGTGKSLLIHQLAHLASASGRGVHLLQWDVARPAFEASAAGRRYPQHHGVTHAMIRIAVGRWARPAIARWDAAQPSTALLVGETPFVGHRFIDLARSFDDAAERVLGSPTARFVIPVPSVSLRRHLEAERARRAAAPVHAREREDAPPDVLRGVWRELVGAAAALGLARIADDADYDPAIYRAVYERLLTRRHVQALMLDERLPTDGVSAYDFRVPTRDLVPSDEESARFIAEAEREYADPAALEGAVAGWFKP